MSKFIHAVTISRRTETVVEDDMGQLVDGTATTSAVMGLVQPRTTKEMLDPRSAGTELADHVIFLPAGTDIRGDDTVVRGDRRYNVTGVRVFDYGGLAHIEVDARLVTAAPVGS